MARSLSQRLLAPIVEVRSGEATTALMMFAYSFLAIASYSIIKPITRSKFITDLGVDNLPYVQLAAGVLIGFIMSAYAYLVSRLPGRWNIPITQVGMVGVLIGFWFLFQTGGEWVSAVFFLLGLILGILLISQFWTLANVVYDARQAKRLFGFIGAGAPLGGIVGSWILTNYAQQIGTINLLLWSASMLTMCLLLASAIIAREREATQEIAVPGADAEKGVGFGEALRLLRSSQHLQIISTVIALAAIGAVIIEQQLNMAAAQEAADAAGSAKTDQLTALLGTVQLWISVIAFVIQIWLTSKIHRFLGVGFALMILPVSLGASAVLMLMTGAFWAAGLARVSDSSLRYTVDKTTREILFLPLPADIKYTAKPFVDVTVDRVAKGLGSVLLLVLIKPWGLNLQADRWPLLSYAALALTVLWMFMAVRARKGYLAAFRRSIERGDVRADELRLDTADLSTIETLVEELASPEPRRVISAIELLESFDKRNLITPLLLHHTSAAVRARALQALGGVKPDVAERWLPSIRRMIADPDQSVRTAAVSALANIRNEQVTELLRPYLQDPDPRLATMAAVVLSRSDRADDVDAAEGVLSTLAADAGDQQSATRRDVAAAIGQIENPRFHSILIPLLYDSDPAVAEEAIRSAGVLRSSSLLLAPTLVSLLRHRALKGAARDVLVSHGEDVLGALNHFMRDPDEDIWIRRHLPATIARIPTQRAVDILVDALNESDGFLRYKALAALERLHHDHPEFTVPRATIEALALREGNRYYNYLTLHYNLFGQQRMPGDTLLAYALTEKLGRTKDRIYRLLGLIYPWKDIGAARWALEHGEARARASASEYLDNVLTGAIRKRLMTLLEDQPLDEKIRKGNVLLKTRAREPEETLLQLINEEDQVVAAAAIDLVEQQKVTGLVDDLEHVLAHRDVRDWYVFEAASWALAAFRMPETRRRELWREPLPTVQLANRLRQIPLFAALSVDELFRIAEAAKQVRHEGGRVLYQEGAVADQVHFLLDGRVTIDRHGEPAGIGEAPAPLGFRQVLDGSPMTETIKTADRSVTLSLTSEQFRQLLSTSPDLVEQLVGMVSHVPRHDQMVVRAQSAAEVTRLSSGGLKPIEQVFMLENLFAVAEPTADEMLALASIARETELQAGASIIADGGRPRIFAVLTGRVRVEPASGGAPVIAGPGEVVGYYETVAGAMFARSAVAETETRGLRIDREDLFELLSQRAVLLQRLFKGLFREEQPVATV